MSATAKWFLMGDATSRFPWARSLTVGWVNNFHICNSVLMAGGARACFAYDGVMQMDGDRVVWSNGEIHSVDEPAIQGRETVWVIHGTEVDPTSFGCRMIDHAPWFESATDRMIFLSHAAKLSPWSKT